MKSKIGDKILHFRLPHVSISDCEDAGCQIEFAESPDSEETYVLLQRHFEPPDDGSVYVESHHLAICGHFGIRKVELRKNELRFNLGSDADETVQISFEAREGQYRQLKKVLGMMIPARWLSIQQ
jgi:hypothetical protein